VFSHPVAITQASVVHALPSSQFLVPPPAVHFPDVHVMDWVHHDPAHEAATQDVPSVASLQAAVFFAVAHTWHASPAFGWPSPWQMPPIRQALACSVLLHPASGSHASVVQAFPSSHDTDVWDAHVPPEHFTAA
jgi:hypothetical protein